MDHKMPASPCTNCGKVLDAAAIVTKGRAKPKPGDYTICIECSHLMAFADDLSLRDLSDSEMHAIAGDKLVLAAMVALAKIRKDRKGETPQ